MTNIPISYNKRSLAEFFYKILTFHIPPTNKPRILDPTCGRRFLWRHFLEKRSLASLFSETGSTSGGLIDKYDVVFSDVKDFGYNKMADIHDLSYDHEFEGIVYDPPYFFGYSGSKDPRRKDYGDYLQSYEDLLWFMDVANDKFPSWLTDNGKLIVKCADQYQTKERKFYPHHYTWINKLNNFNLIDFFVFIHHRLSPTAFQVKNRPCSVIMHTYFLIFKVR